MGFKSEPGLGSAFWIDLPTDRQGGAQPPGGPPGERWGADVPPVAASRTVLYVVDIPSNLLLMEEILGRIPRVAMLSTHTAEQALDMARDRVPDLIIVDINLPGLNGLQALERLKASPETTHVPVVAVNADAMPDEVERGLKAGFRAYLTKPIDTEEVRRTVVEVLDELS